MSNLAIGYLGLASIFVLIALRVPVGLVLGLIAFFGVCAVSGLKVAYGLLETVPFDFAANWTFSAIPMFLLMGAIAHLSGISSDVFRAARLWLGALPGGLALATNFACAGFAAASGSSMATAAAMGRIAIPEMLRLRYQKGFATATVASAGTLGTLIPPSISMIVYGIFAEVSVSKLFVAGILPGILSALIYAIMIIGRCRANPSLAPVLEESVTWPERWRSLRNIWPLMLLIVCILAGLYGGVVTATEAGALGAFVALVISILQRRMSFAVFYECVIDALSQTASIFFVAMGAVLLTRFLAISGVAAHLASFVEHWGGDPLPLVLASSVIFLVLGMFLNPLGLMLLSLPILLPLYRELDLDLIWFGILVIKFIEIGLITPPVGMNVYVIKSVVGDEVELDTIFKGVAWFLVCDLITVAILIAFPDITTALVARME